MSDNIYRVLMGDNAPFGGLANLSYYDRIVRGRIVKVHYNPMSETLGENGKHILNQQSYRTVDIDWLEGKPFTSENVHIPELVSFLGYGLNYLPSKDDIVLAGFDCNDNPHILNIVARCSAYEHGSLENSTRLPSLNKYGDVRPDEVIADAIRPTPIRYIEPGEISLTSLNNNNELYFDKFGTAKLISRIPILTCKDSKDIDLKTNVNGLQCGDRLWEISIGQDIYKETDKGPSEIKKSSFGNNIQFQILGHKNDCKVDFDSEGNVELNTNRCNIQVDKDGIITATISNGEQIRITSSGIFLGNGTTQQAVLGNKLETLLIELINAFNAHTHTGNLGYPTDSPKVTVDMKEILSETVELK